MPEKNLLFSVEILGGFLGVALSLVLLTVAMPFALIYSVFSGKTWDSFLGGILGIPEEGFTVNL